MNSKPVFTYKRSIITISAIGLCVLLLTRCNDAANNKKAPTAITPPTDGSEFTGSAACANCHKAIFDNHIKTAHYLTSQAATAGNIMGSFEPGKNEFIFSPYSKIIMEKRDSGFYQADYEMNIEKKARPFSIVVGSGKKGQTYLYWYKNNLGQLPISYFTPAAQWSNSPGYGNRLIFNRPVTSRCLECHSTYFKTISAANVEPEQFSHNQVVYGVDCEKCHGAAANHVAFQTQHPSVTTASYIINPKTFSRQQSLDMCSLCHSGRLTKTQPSFSFTAGNKLTDFFATDTAVQEASEIDVHGNQYGLLAASKCFKNSQMTCNTCHSPHENETGRLAIFSQRCSSCHNNEPTAGHGKVCKLSTAMGAAINNNCIDCHMPEQPSKAIAMQLQGEEMAAKAFMRSHFIKIYPEASRQFLQKNKK